MRSRREIEKDWEMASGKEEREEIRSLILEVLLDIRDLLKEGLKG